MIPKDYDDFCAVVVGFAELKGKTLSSAAIELYWRAMQHWTLVDFKLAAEQLLRTSDWMPTPKEFEDLRKAGRPTAGEAWAVVLRYVRTDYSPSGLPVVNGADTKPKGEAINRAVAALGGYRAIALSNTENTQFLERRFAEHYETIQEADDVREAVPQIAQQGTPRRLGADSLVRQLARDKA